MKLGDKDNQPQVTYVPVMVKFESLYADMKEWIEDAYFEGDDE